MTGLIDLEKRDPKVVVFQSMAPSENGGFTDG